MVIGEDLMNITVREVMSSPVVYISLDGSVYDAVKLMEENNINNLVVVDKKKPLGIITTDIISRTIVDLKRDPKEITMRELPIEPFVTIKADTTVIEITRLFSRKKPPIVGVTYKGKLVGVVTVSDLMRVIPDIIDAIMEKLSFEQEPSIKVNSYVMGYCDRCGAWSDKLLYVDGNYYCPDCMVDLFGEETYIR